MTHARIVSIFLSIFTLLSATPVRGDSVLDHLPDDAIGFAHIRNLAATNAKIERVIKIFQEASPMPIPAPLPVIKAATGLGAGLNEQGDALLALLPGDEGMADPRPLLIVAVSNYAEFARSISGDETGEICRVTIAGEEVLMARRGDFAALMNIEHRDQLEALLASDSNPPVSIDPLTKWLATTDVAVVITPIGVEALTSASRSVRRSRQRTLNFNGTPDVLRQLYELIAMQDELLGLFGAELSAAAAGLSIDDDANVKLLTRAILSKSGALAGNSEALPSLTSPLAGYADQPYIVALGGMLPAGFAKSASAAVRDAIKANPATHGFENLTDDEWQKVQDAWNAYLQGIESVSAVAYLGADEDPLVSNIYGVLKVEDSQKYLDSYRESIKLENELLSRTTSDIDMKYELADAEIDGRQGLLTTVNLGVAMDDPNVPTIKFLVDGLLGKDGLLKTYLIPTDAGTVAFGIDEEAGVAAALKAVAAQESGLADSAAVQMTAKLLDPDATWMAMVNPSGVVTWVGRFTNKLLAHLGPGAPELPAFPPTPPVGLTLSMAGGQFGLECVWPAETLKGVAGYLKKLQDSF